MPPLSKVRRPFGAKSKRDVRREEAPITSCLSCLVPTSTHELTSCTREAANKRCTNQPPQEAARCSQAQQENTIRGVGTRSRRNPQGEQALARVRRVASAMLSQCVTWRAHDAHLRRACAACTCYAALCCAVLRCATRRSASRVPHSIQFSSVQFNSLIHSCIRSFICLHGHSHASLGCEPRRLLAR